MNFLLYLALVPALAIAAQWLAWRTRLPGILLLLLIGIALGTVVRPDDLLAELAGGQSGTAGPNLLFPLVSLAVAVIMFEGGLTLKLSDLREAGGAALRLCTVGTMVTLVGTAVVAQFCFPFSWRVSFLLGAILIVTGPTVVGPLLRQVQPSSRVGNTLKWEGIVSDPMGAVFAVLVFEVLMLNPKEAGVLDGALLLLKTAAVGGIVGIVAGWIFSSALRRFWIPDHLHGFAALASSLLLFAACDQLAHESGLIAVTVLGVWLTNQDDLEIEHLIEFKENLRTILIGCLFILLASRVDLSDLSELAWSGILFVTAMILLVRPLAVFTALLGSGMNYREQSFIAGLAPRGIVAAAVSSVFALRMEQLDGLEAAGADQFADVAFMAIIGTVTIYGLLASPLAKLLGVANPDRNGILVLGADDWVIQFAKEVKKSGFRVLLIDTNYRKITRAKLEDLEAVCANIVNEHVQEELSLSGIGNFLAMTSNDPVNSLAIRECRSLFGRSNTFQLTFKTDNRRELTKNLMGRELFGADLSHRRITELFRGGMEFKTTRLSEEFTMQDFRTRYAGAMPFALIGESGALQIVTSKSSGNLGKPKAIIALVENGQSSGGPPSANQKKKSGRKKNGAQDKRKSERQQSDQAELDVGENPDAG